MINNLIDSICKLLLKAVDNLPEIEKFTIPDTIYDGIDSIFGFVGWVMPYSLYAPLILFILSLTAFRIAYAVYLHFKK